MIDNISNICENNNKGNDFYIFENRDGKKWIIPCNQKKIGLLLYQPSSWKGKLIKRLFPIISKIPQLRRVIRVKCAKYKLIDELYDCIAKAFEIEKFNFSIFGGTPGKHQKITIQIINNNNILGYVKVCFSRDVYNNFVHECRILENLQERGITNIPNVLVCGKLNSLFVFIQTTNKTNNSKTYHKLNSTTVNDIVTFCDQSKHNCFYSDSDYYLMINRLKKTIEEINGRENRIIAEAMSLVDKYFRKHNEFYAYHGDFTPWNIYREHNKTYMFDFEYGELSYPKYLDLFHFYTQTMYFEHRKNSKYIYTNYKHTLRNTLFSFIEDTDFYYLAYLLASICLYTERDGVNSLRTNKLVKTWVDITEYLLEDIGCNKS